MRPIWKLWECPRCGDIRITLVRKPKCKLCFTTGLPKTNMNVQEWIQ